LGSGLSKINFLSELIIVGKSNEVVTKENAAAISETAKVLIDNMRDLIWALNPENTTLENLLVRIREFASDYLEEYCSEVKMIFPDEVPDMDISKESHREIFMAIKECLNNIVKHSNAKTVECEAAISDSVLMLTIKDNGIGLPLYTSGTGNGLQNMKCRMEAIGGNFHLESVPGNGTRVGFKIELTLLARLLPV